MVLVSSQMSLVRTLPSYFFEIHFNIISRQRPGLQRCPFPSGLPIKILDHVYYIPYTFLLSLIYHPYGFGAKYKLRMSSLCDFRLTPRSKWELRPSGMGPTDYAETSVRNYHCSQCNKLQERLSYGCHRQTFSRQCFCAHVVHLTANNRVLEKYRVPLEQATKAQRGSRGIAVLFL